MLLITLISGKKIPLDVDSIEVIHGDAKFILLVENTFTDNWLNKVNDDVCCISVTTTIWPPDDATKKFLCKLQRKLQLKVCVLLDCIAESLMIMSDLIGQDALEILWLGIHASDVPILLRDGIQVENVCCSDVIPDRIFNKICGEHYLIAQPHLRDQVRLMKKYGWHVPIKTLPYKYLVDYYLPNKLRTYGVPGF